MRTGEAGVIRGRARARNLHEVAGDGRSVHVIREPGTYVLGTDVVGKVGYSGVRIECDGVVLELNGREIRGCPGSHEGVYVPFLAANVTVRNGSVSGWGGDGVDLSCVIGCRVANLVIRDNRGFGLLLGSGAFIDGCTVDRNGNRAVAAVSAA